MTIDFIPIQFYTPLYYYTMLAVVLFTVLHTQIIAIDSSSNLKYIRTAGIGLLFFVLVYIGLRPIHGVFIDMVTYSKMFERFGNSQDFSVEYDFLFYILMFGASKIMTVEAFFFLCATLYVVPLFLACKKWFAQYWFYAFLMLVISFSFWAYGTNGIRNGIATSIFLFAISREKRFNQILWILISIGLHKSMLLPSFGFLVTQFNNSTSIYLKFWLICIPFSLFAGSFLETAITNLGFGDDRMGMYLTDDEFGSGYNRGFRWDFLLYSSTGVVAGWYMIFKRNFKDKLYSRLFNIYLFANGFWILIITASFSNRFAYLSWFLLGVLIIYPLLKGQLFRFQHRKIGGVILGYFLFTYIMNVILI